jgi:chaperonin cofactor prefoldin
MQVQLKDIEKVLREHPELIEKAIIELFYKKPEILQRFIPYNLATKEDFKNLLTKEEFKIFVDMVNKRFEAVDKRFEDMNKRFEDMNKRFEDMNRRFEDMNKRFKFIEKILIVILSCIVGMLSAVIIAIVKLFTL